MKTRIITRLVIVIFILANHSTLFSQVNTTGKHRNNKSAAYIAKQQREIDSIAALDADMVPVEESEPMSHWIDETTNSSEVAFNRLKQYYQFHTLQLCKEIYFNRGDKSLQICSIQIPLDKVKVVYTILYFNANKGADGSHEANIACINGDCLAYLYSTGERQYAASFGISFRNAEECYDFIRLFNDLLDTLKA